MKTGIVAIVSAALISLGAASAAEIKVLSTQATEQSYRELIPLFEKATGHKVTTLFTGTLDADKRIAAGEPYDLLDHVAVFDRCSTQRAARSCKAAASISHARASRSA